MSFRALFSSLLLWLYAGPDAGAAPVPVIFDTDMGNDIDDALPWPSCMPGEPRRSEDPGVTITKDNRWAAPYVDLVNTFYGRGASRSDGARRQDAERQPHDSGPRRTHPATARRSIAPHPDSSQAPEAVSVLRRLLAGNRTARGIRAGWVQHQPGAPARFGPGPGQPAHGRELVAKKARLLSVMAGNFADGRSEFNVREDVPAARKVFDEWPTPIVASGFEIGQALRFPGRSIENDFAYVKDHPVARATATT